MSYTFKAVFEDDIVYLVSVIWEYPEDENDYSEFTVESVVPFKATEWLIINQINWPRKISFRGVFYMSCFIDRKYRICYNESK